MFLSDYKRFPVCLPMAGSVGDPDSLGYVYVIGFGEADIVKIGHATCLSSRLTALQCATPFELHLRAAVSIYSHDPVLIEQAAHRLAKREGAHIRGEWFDLEVDDALRCIIEAAKSKRAKYGAWAKSVDADLQAAKDRAKGYDDERREKMRVKLGIA